MIILYILAVVEKINDMLNKNQPGIDKKAWPSKVESRVLSGTRNG